MTSPVSNRSLLIAGCCIAILAAISLANAEVNVTQHHNHASRDGVYIDPVFTQSAAANLTRDLNFDGTIAGNVYAQPLYIEGGPGGKAIVIAVTESNNVYALDVIDGSIIWQRNVGDPVPADDLVCSVVDPLGISGTPIVDLASRALFFDAMTTPDGGKTKKHLIFSLNVDTGDINPGWPIDVGETAVYNNTTFTPSVQAQRAALGILDNILYVPYGSLVDCSVYHGWLIGVPIDNPASATAWATDAIGGGIWGTNGVSNDGTNLFVATGNTFSTNGNWGGGEAVIRFQPGPTFTGNPSDYWAPTNWLQLDQGDSDLGSSGALLLDVPGAIPSRLVVALGKDGKAYLLNRDDLGGIIAPVASTQASTHFITQAAVTYRTKQGTYIAFRDGVAAFVAFRITASNPPNIVFAWTASQSGRASPFVTSTDGTNDAIVWIFGASGDRRLHGFNGDTGQVVYAGGGPNELLPGGEPYNSGIAANGRIYIANDNKVYALRLPTSTPTPTPTPVTPTPTPTSTATPSVTPTPTTTPRASPRPRPTPHPRPTPQ
jgi:outer membrane protein assembly factor BamB